MGSRDKSKFVFLLVVLFAVQTLSLPNPAKGTRYKYQPATPIYPPPVVEETVPSVEEYPPKIDELILTPLEPTEAIYEPTKVIDEPVEEVIEVPPPEVIYTPVEVIEIPAAPELTDNPVEVIEVPPPQVIYEPVEVIDIPVPSEEVAYSATEVIEVPVTPAEVIQVPPEVIYEPSEVIEVYPEPPAISKTAVVPETKEVIYVVPDVSVQAPPAAAGEPEVGELPKPIGYKFKYTYPIENYDQFLRVPYQQDQLIPFSFRPPPAVDQKVIYEKFQTFSNNFGQYRPDFSSVAETLLSFGPLDSRNANPEGESSPIYSPQDTRHFPTYESQFGELTNGNGEFLKDVNFIEKALEVTKVLGGLKGFFTPILQQLVTDSSGSNVLEICKLSKARLLLSNADDAFTANFVHFIKGDSADFDKKCRFESFRAYRVLEDALTGIAPDLKGFPELVQELNSATLLIEAAIQSLTLKTTTPFVEPY